MSKLDLTDMSMLLIFMIWLTGVNFADMSVLSWILCGVMATWFTLFLVKVVLIGKKALAK